MKKETAMKLPIGPRKGSIVGNVTSKRNIVSFCNVLTVISLFLIPMLAFAENSDGENAKTATPKKTVETCWDTLNTSEAPEKNWGTYYDPKGVFCGDYDCYRILGFCYDEWGRKPPTTRELTQSYRRIGRVWHPDKNKMEGAEDRFAVSLFCLIFIRNCPAFLSCIIKFCSTSILTRYHYVCMSVPTEIFPCCGVSRKLTKHTRYLLISLFEKNMTICGSVLMNTTINMDPLCCSITHRSLIHLL